MRKLVRVLFQGVVICGLMLSVIGGCRDKTDEVDGTPEDLGEQEKTYDIDIYEEDWIDADALDTETASIYETIYFDLDRSTIRKEYQPVLDRIADDLKANGNRYVRAVGHCCSLGTNEYNFGLGERRAESVRSYLTKLGVDADRVRTLSKGEEEPAVPNTDQGHPLNRRVEFQLYER
jgi:peptidoglycan-associated lipoprotein